MIDHLLFLCINIRFMNEWSVHFVSCDSCLLFLFTGHFMAKLKDYFTIVITASNKPRVQYLIHY